MTSPEQARAAAAYADQEQQEPVVVRDKRRFDPATGELRDAAPAGDTPPPEGAGGDPETEALRTQLSERVADLQRLKAEFDNYRRRVERDRQANADAVIGRVLLGLLPTLDDISRARTHGDLNGAFKTVAETLEGSLSSLGLESYGAVGEAFDPQLHEALVYSHQSGLEGPTTIEVYRAGYRHAGRVLRPAQVVVAEPPAGEANDEGGATDPATPTA